MPPLEGVKKRPPLFAGACAMYNMFPDHAAPAAVWFRTVLGLAPWGRSFCAWMITQSVYRVNSDTTRV